jgi:hypothetical protein
LKEKALDRTQWRTRFGRGYEPVVRQTTEWISTLIPWMRVLFEKLIATVLLNKYHAFV